MKLLGAALILCGAAPNAMRCSAHGGRSVPPCGLSAALESLERGIRASLTPLPRLLGQRGRGKYADAFFADVLAQLENGTPLPDGWREAAARTPLGEREQAVAIRSCRHLRRGGGRGAPRPARGGAGAARYAHGAGAAERAGYPARDDALLQPESPCHDTAYLNRKNTLHRRSLWTLIWYSRSPPSASWSRCSISCSCASDRPDQAMLVSLAGLVTTMMLLVREISSLF